MRWVKRLVDHVIQDRVGQGDLEFAWADPRPADPAAQAKMLDLYVRTGIYTVNEARDILGFEPVPGGDQAMVYGTAGAMPLAAPAPVAAKRSAAVAPFIKANFDPAEPRVPADNPGGGEWTEGGDGGGASEDSGSASSGSSGGHSPGPGAGESEPRHITGGRVWESFPSSDFRNRLAVAEQTADKPNFGYGEVNRRSGALGRYQVTRVALQAAGMMDAHGNWTGKYGIHSAAQFLANPQAQEMALTDLLAETERQLRANGAFQYMGRRIDGHRGVFSVTLAGLLAAAHREGAPATRDYLEQIEEYGFHTRGHVLRPPELRIETRMRTFSGVPYE